MGRRGWHRRSGGPVRRSDLDEAWGSYCARRAHCRRSACARCSMSGGDCQPARTRFLPSCWIPRDRHRPDRVRHSASNGARDHLSPNPTVAERGLVATRHRHWSDSCHFQGLRTGQLNPSRYAPRSATDFAWCDGTVSTPLRQRRTRSPDEQTTGLATAGCMSRLAVSRCGFALVVVVRGRSRPAAVHRFFRRSHQQRVHHCSPIRR